jgi:hypothetical protein
MGPNDHVSSTEAGICQTDLKQNTVNFTNKNGFDRKRRSIRVTTRLTLIAQVSDIITAL